MADTMEMSAERRAYVEYRLRLSKDWVLAMTKQMPVELKRNPEEAERLVRLCKKEEEFQDALTHALDTNQDTLALL
jgi:hypothetical protein